MRRFLFQASVGLVIFSIPIGVRVLLHNFISGFHEYEAVFVYGSDLFLIAALGMIIYFWKEVKLWLFLIWENFRGVVIFGTTFFVLNFISFLWAPSPALSLYFSLRLFLAVIFGVVIGFLIFSKRITIKAVFVFLVITAVFQSVLGLSQFAHQSDLGLRILGEPALSVTIPGVAKVVAYGTRFIRGYGTFPHPNIFSAFLLLGLATAYYLYLKSDWIFNREKYDFQKGYAYNFKALVKSGHFHERILVSGAIFLIIAGLLVTFSRTAWGIAALATIGFLGWGVGRTMYRRPVLRLLPVIIFSVVILFMQFRWIIIPRASIASSDQSIIERLSYVDLGRELIASHPLGGVGAGNQVLYAVQNNLYSRFGFSELWQWQPIHNIYLLIASEIGIFGLMAFLGFIFLLIFSSQFSIKHCNIDTFNKNWNLEFGIWRTMFVSLLLFGLFDHFSWTLGPGRLMLWLVIGVVLGLLVGSKPSNQVTNQPINRTSARSTTDRTHPSEG